jgi:hypothetical protein
LYSISLWGGDIKMKTMTCKQLAGACDEEFHAETFEEMAETSKKHAMEMAEKGDEAHIKKMEEMMLLMDKPEEVKEWFEKVQKEFDALPENK